MNILKRCPDNTPITFKDAPQVPEWPWFKNVLHEGYYKLKIKKYYVVISPFDKKRVASGGWCITRIHENKENIVVEIGADKNTFIDSIKTHWPRAALHELCHIKLMELYGTADVISGHLLKEVDGNFVLGSKKVENLFSIFVDMMSPEGFREFLVDLIYMKHFPEFGRYFKPEMTNSIQSAFNALIKTRERDYWSFSHLFYIWRCVFTADRYNESRPKYRQMINELMKRKRYKHTLIRLNTLFKSWSLPPSRRALDQNIHKVYQIYSAFIR